VTPIPSFPQIQTADLGEGELRVGMKREIINTKVQVRLVVVRELQSATGEELSELLPSISLLTTVRRIVSPNHRLCCCIQHLSLVQYSVIDARYFAYTCLIAEEFHQDLPAMLADRHGYSGSVFDTIGIHCEHLVPNGDHSPAPGASENAELNGL
jgi:hypothetical protein